MALLPPKKPRPPIPPPTPEEAEFFLWLASRQRPASRNHRFPYYLPGTGKRSPYAPGAPADAIEEPAARAPEEPEAASPPAPRTPEGWTPGYRGLLTPPEPRGILDRPQQAELSPPLLSEGLALAAAFAPQPQPRPAPEGWTPGYRGLLDQFEPRGILDRPESAEEPRLALSHVLTHAEGSAAPLTPAEIRFRADWAAIQPMLGLRAAPGQAPVRSPQRSTPPAMPEQSVVPNLPALPGTPGELVSQFGARPQEAGLKSQIAQNTEASVQEDVTEPGLADHVARRVINRTITLEGGYVSDPDDPGGPTNLGLSLNKLGKAIGLTEQDIRSMTYERAVELYKKHFYDQYNIGHLPQKLQYQLFDFVVNAPSFKTGSEAVRLFQSTLNDFGYTDAEGETLIEDGILGSRTLQAVSKIVTESDLIAVNNALVDKRAGYYKEFADRDETGRLRKFLSGWLRRAEGFRQDPGQTTESVPFRYREQP